MKKQVQTFIKKHNLLPPNSTVVVGVSGGPDSLALLHLLWSMREHYQLNVVAAHVDHMFRGRESEEDMKYVMHYCQSLDVKCEAKQIDVASYQQEKGMSSQAAARECRYNFFKQVMTKYHADTLALGHHGDDQVETILMKLVRGSTMTGYAGIRPIRPFGTGSLIRPLLSVIKSDVLHYCEKNDLQPRIDRTNEKDDYTRNRFRRYVLPFLKKENPLVHQRFQHFSESLCEDQEFLEELAAEAMNKVMKKKEGQEIVIKVDAFLKVSKPLQRRAIQLILNYLYKEIPPTISMSHTESLLSLLESDLPSGMLHFPSGLKVSRSYNDCSFTFEDKKPQRYICTLPVPGNVTLPNGHEIVCEIHNEALGGRGNNTFALSEEEVRQPLIIRTRKIGDKMTIKGMKGRKKVKDIFIDEKIPLKERDEWPVVENGNGEILWLPGLKKSIYELTEQHDGRYVILYYK